MKNKIMLTCLFITTTLFMTGCIIKTAGIPNGGASVIISKPIWISGIKTNEKYTFDFPSGVETEKLKITNAGLWLANTNGKLSQLIYSVDISIKKPFSKSRVYTKSILSNPSNKNKPIIYNHYLDLKDKNTKITHATLDNVKMYGEYKIILEVYEDKEKKVLISRLEQNIVSAVDNIGGCIKLDQKLKERLYGHLVKGDKNIKSLDHLVIHCDKF